MWRRRRRAIAGKQEEVNLGGVGGGGRAFPGDPAAGTATPTAAVPQLLTTHVADLAFLFFIVGYFIRFPRGFRLTQETVKIVGSSSFPCAGCCSAPPASLLPGPLTGVAPASPFPWPCRSQPGPHLAGSSMIEEAVPVLGLHWPRPSCSPTLTTLYRCPAQCNPLQL